MNELDPNQPYTPTPETTATDTTLSTQTNTQDSEKITGEHDAVNMSNPGSGVFANLKRLFFKKRVDG